MAGPSGFWLKRQQCFNNGDGPAMNTKGLQGAEVKQRMCKQRDGSLGDELDFRVHEFGLSDLGRMPINM
jgi:hypothetical protein